MYILAYKDGHDPAACLLKDGRILAAVEEERFTRQKHAPSVFPQKSIKFCLEFANLSEKEVNYVVYSRLKPWRTAIKVFAYYLKRPPCKKTEWRYFLMHSKLQFVGTIKELFKKAGYQKIRRLFPNLPKKIYSFDHHLCHAASAYYFSGFDESSIITYDGKGEATSVMVAHGKDNEIKILERKGIFESLGIFYSSATEYLGFTPNDGEYKVMGLAPYGESKISFDSILRPDKRRGYKINSDFVLYPFSLKNFETRFGKIRKREQYLSGFHKDFAASLQKSFEDSVLSLVKYALKKTNSRNLCLAGGVALNVKLNKKILESGLIDNFFVQPAAGDDGLVLGAAALLFSKLTGKRAEPLKDLYFGPKYSEEEVKKVLDKEHLIYHRYDNEELIDKTVYLITEGNVVGWFQGRMEFGPRALGDRSILAHPGIAGMKDMVNMKIKFREGFRPFCPSILAEYADQYFKNYRGSPYMILSFSTNGNDIDNKIPAVVHVDGTVRPQSVTRATNPLYYDLINSFYKKTGVAAVLNTSMNVRGEPIVCTPKDAANFFLRTNVDALVIGNFLVNKKDQDKSLLKILPDSGLDTQY